MAQENRFKKTRLHAEFISASYVQVSAGKVCNRQVGDLSGVNVLWDAEINWHDVRFLTLELPQTDGKAAINFKRDFPAR